MRGYAFLVHPSVGGGAAADAVVPVARRLRDRGAPVAVTYVPGPRAIARLCAEATRRGEVVVSVGGDVMLAAVAGHVARLGGVLGLAPVGPHHDFASAVGVPAVSEDPGRVAELLRGTPRPVDLISLALPGREPRVVVGTVCAGVAARAVPFGDRLGRLTIRLQQPLPAVGSRARSRPVRVRLDVDGQQSCLEVAHLVVANAGHGRGLRLPADARVDDGLLEVVAVPTSPRRSLARDRASHPLSSARAPRPEAAVQRGRRVRVEVVGDAKLPVGADGESCGDLLPGSPPLGVDVLPGALRLLH